MIMCPCFLTGDGARVLLGVNIEKAQSAVCRVITHSGFTVAANQEASGSASTACMTNRGVAGQPALH